MKPFLLFAGPTYYPSKAWNDFKGSFNSQEEAMEAACNMPEIDWWQIVDARSERLVKEGKRNY